MRQETTAPRSAPAGNDSRWAAAPPARGFTKRGLIHHDGLTDGLAICESLTEPAAAGQADRLPDENGRRWLILQMEGDGIVSQGGTRLTVLAGDLVLLDPLPSAELTHLGRSRQLRALLPAAVSPPPRRVPRPPMARLIKGTSGLGTALGSLMMAAHAGRDVMNRREHLAFAAAVLDLLEAAPAEAPAAEAMPEPGGPRLSPLKQSIDQSLSDPALRPARIAARHGISVRHLHRLFRQTGLSFTAYVRQRRLAQARADLLNPALAALSVTEIALRWGFSDSAHFSRCFRAAFGCTARSLRARLTAPAAAPLNRVRPLPSSDRSPGGSDG